MRWHWGFLLCCSLLACDQPLLQATAIPDYESARQVFWDSLYTKPATTLYCNKQFDGHNRRGINIEHVFPMSWVTNALQCGTRKQCRERSTEFNRIEADLHNLYPSLTTINAARSSHRFGEVRGESRRYGTCDFEVNPRARVAEPAPAVRGEVARAMFYMAYMYRAQGLVIFARSGKLLQQWHNEDPPNMAERERNARIAELQGNTNPFIDQPDKLNQLIAERYFY